MDFVNLRADKNVIMNKHFTVGREGRDIRHVIIHHNDGYLTTEGCWQVWQDRQASAHYQVEQDGTIGQLVWDRDTAWQAGTWEENLQSIGIEHANNSRDPHWCSDETVDAGAHLVAAICRYYGLGRPQWGVNVFPHQAYQSTSCPGSLYGGQKARYTELMEYYYDNLEADSAPEASVNVPPANAGGSGDLEALADAVMRGEYGNGDERRSALGDNYDAVQAIVNQRMGVAPQVDWTPAPAPSVNLEALADAVMRGEYGDGDARVAALGSNYDAVQAIVNARYGLGSSQSHQESVDLEALADAVMRGEYGDGDDRRNALGGNYDAVQAIVNQRYGF